MSNKIKIVLVLFLALVLIKPGIAFAENLNDYLYSAEYFDYLIECAENEKYRQEELKKNNEEEIEIFDNVTIYEPEEEIAIDDMEPFSLRIEKNSTINPYGETFKKENSKTIIPIGNKFSFTQDMTKFRNKYASLDYKILAGFELTPVEFFYIATGLEANYRDIDQNPVSRKLYFTPGIKITDKLSLSFPNKINVSTHSTDHDIGLKVSPFKSKFLDFGMYAGITKTQSGKQTESIKFSTDLYLF